MGGIKLPTIVVFGVINTGATDDIIWFELISLINNLNGSFTDKAINQMGFATI
jgi:hypothetical protein